MKRKISIFLVLILCFGFWSVPVQAAESNIDSWINVLDFVNPNDTSSNTVYLSKNSVNSIVFNFPDSLFVGYVDILFRTNEPFPAMGRYVNGAITASLNIVKVSDRLFRAYGYLNDYATFLNLGFQTTTGTWLDFLTFNISTSNYLFYNTDAYCEIHAQEFDSTIHFVYSDDVNGRVFDAPSNVDLCWYYLFIYSYDWKKYDYLDFQLSLDVSSIDSIIARQDAMDIPLEISYLSPNDNSVNSYFVNIRMDLRGLDRIEGTVPMIKITGALAPGVANRVDFISTGGVVIPSSFDPLGFYFENLNSWISSQTSAIKSLNNNVYSYFQTLFTQLSGHTETVTGLFGTLGTNLNTLFSSLESLIDTDFSALTSTISARFNTLSNNLAAWYDSLETVIENEFSKHTSTMSVRFNTLSTNLQAWFNSLELTIKGDAHAGDDFQDDVSGKDQELEDMSSVMDSVTRPALDQIDVSVDSYVTQSDITTLTAPLLVFFTGDVFGPIVIMSILMATVSYVLYGKR